MPTAPVLLARGCVLGAADVAARVSLQHTDVAADALAHLSVAALLDLPREEGVGDGRARSADQVPGARADDLGHPIGVREPADANDRLPSRLAHAASQFRLLPLQA